MAISLYPVDWPFAIFKVLPGEHPFLDGEIKGAYDIKGLCDFHLLLCEHSHQYSLFCAPASTLGGGLWVRGGYWLWLQAMD